MARLAQAKSAAAQARHAAATAANQEWFGDELGWLAGLFTATDPERAARLRRRVADSVARLAPTYPGDATTGLLPEFAEPSEASEAFESAFDGYANDEPCPVLDPATGTCDLYAARPMTCRTFGPPVLNDEGGFAVCELCFQGASPQQVAACEMRPDPGGLEDRLLDQLREQTGAHGQTIIAFALRD